MAAYLLAFVIAYLLARDMLMVSYICRRLVKFLIVTFLFLRQRFASHLRGFCYLVDFLQLAPLQRISLRVLVNWLEAQIQPDLCSGLLQGSCPFFFFLQGSCLVFGVVSNLHLSRQNIIT